MILNSYIHISRNETEEMPKYATTYAGKNIIMDFKRQ